MPPYKDMLFEGFAELDPTGKGLTLQKLVNWAMKKWNQAFERKVTYQVA